MANYSAASKVPRWVSTEAGSWAWQALTAWRNQAANALTVQERRQLLHEAERLWQETAAGTPR